MAGKSRNRRRTAEHSKYFPQLLCLLINAKRNAALQRKGLQIAKFLPKAAGQFCLLSYWLKATIWAFPSSFPIPLRIAQRLSNSLWAFPSASYTLLAESSGCPTAFKSISHRLSAKTWQFPSLFSEGTRFC
jgi:hypothetical protein